MGVLGESWCFCSGSGKSERMKGSIFCCKGPAMATVCGGTGFLIHRALLLTTHANLPSVAAAEGVEISFQCQVTAGLVPHRFFITSSVLDLTVVAFDIVDGDSQSHGQHRHYLKTCSHLSLDLGSVVYLLGHKGRKELTVGEGKVVIATDNLIKLSTDGVTWSPGSAGFDVQGNLAFMVCDPMKLASSPTAKSSSTISSSSSKKDLPMQFGIPIPIICHWLNQQWEGCLDELSKPKINLIRLMSTGQKSEHSSSSLTLRRVFKSTEGESADASPTQVILRPANDPGSSSSATANPCQKESPLVDLHSSNTREQGIPTPEIYESPRMTADLIKKKENTQLQQLLDMNFPSRVPRVVVLPLSIKEKNLSSNCQNMLSSTGNNNGKPTLHDKSTEEDSVWCSVPVNHDADDGIVPSGSMTENCSEVRSSSPLEVLELQDERDGLHAECSSEGETMYSAETMESRNYSIPREEKLQQVRSQSCVSYSRWGANHQNSIGRRVGLEKQQSFIRGRKMYSQAVSQRGHDYFSPTVSSIMKKRNSSEPLSRPRSSAAQLSPRWVF